MLRILVALGDAEYAEDFMMALLPRGYEVYIVERHETLLQLAEKYTPHVVIFDADAEIHNKIDGLTELRSVPALKQSHFIVFSRESGLEFVKATMKLGAIGYLFKPISQDMLRDQLTKNLAQVESMVANRREFVRVKPGPFEKTGVELAIPGEQAISGVILDISLGGVAFRLARPERIRSITIGKTYHDLHLSMEHVGTIATAGVAVLARGDSAAFQFTGLNDAALKALCRYIHSKLVMTAPEDPHAQYMKLV